MSPYLCRRILRLYGQDKTIYFALKRRGRHLQRDLIYSIYMNKTVKNITLILLTVGVIGIGFIVTQISEPNTVGNVSTEQPATSTDQIPAKELTFSNLVDPVAQAEVRTAMEYAGIAPENIDSFFQDVDSFNTTVERTTLVPAGFTTIDATEPEYDLMSMIDLWDAENPLFIGYNCRLTTFDLMKDLITVTNPDTTTANWMMFDKNALEYNPKKLFTDAEYQDFQTLFGSVPAEKTKDIQVHLKNVQAEWARKGITFNTSDRLSVISVFFHDFEDYLFIGHMGVLIETEDGGLLFIEKLAFQAPYQAVKFNNRTELNDYLMTKYDVSYNQPEAKPFIMENDQLLKGYRASQTNLVE